MAGRNIVFGNVWLQHKSRKLNIQIFVQNSIVGASSGAERTFPYGQELYNQIYPFSTRFFYTTPNIYIMLWSPRFLSRLRIRHAHRYQPG
jgi:hypothetical protein